MIEQPIIVNGQPFFGRVEEQKQFRQVLGDMLNTPPNETLPYVILLYGDGGIGKTTLARRFRDIAQSEFQNQFQTLWVDWEDERRRAPRLQIGREHIGAEEIFDSLYAIAVRQGWKTQFDQYQDALKVRSEAEQKVAEVLSAPDEKDNLADLRGASATLIAKLIRFASPISIGDAGEGLVKAFADAGIKGGAESLARLRAAATNRLKARLDPDKLDMFLNPHERLAAELAQGLKKVIQRQPLIVFLDTYEIVDRADIWLRLVMLETGSRVLWVISGRDNLLRSRQFGSEYFKGYADDFPRRLLSYDMLQLARDDIRDYFLACVPDRPVSDDALEAISRATRGIPLAVREAADIWKTGQPLQEVVHDIDDDTLGEQIVRRMTERYQIHCMHDEADSRALYALALARGKIEILRAMLSPGDDKGWSLEPELRRLERDYASVHRERARLHDEPAAFFFEYLKPELRRTEPWMQHFIQRAVDILRTKLDKLNADLPLVEERCEDESWVETTLDLANYLLWLDQDQGWRWFIPRFVEGLGYSEELRQGLVKVVDEWERWLGDRDKKLFRIIRASNTGTIDAEEALLHEFFRLERKGWLAGDGERERHAILDLRRGELYYKQGRFDAAIELYEQVEHDLPPDGERLKRNLGRALQGTAIKLVKAGDGLSSVPSAEAERIALKAVEFLPEAPDAWYSLGWVLQISGKYQQALASLEKASALDPKYAPTYMALSSVFRGLKRWEEALEAAQQAVVLSPEADNSHNCLGNVYRALRQHDAALAAYQKALSLAPDHAGIHYNLGLTYRDLGHDEQAIFHFRQSIALNPKYANPHDALGEIYRRLGRFEEAISTYQAAIALDPDSVWPRVHLAAVCRNLGRKAEYTEQIAIVRPLIEKESTYGRACFEAVCGNTEEALTLLEVALAQKTIPLDWARRDPDLDSIRDDPRFTKLVGE